MKFLMLLLRTTGPIVNLLGVLGICAIAVYNDFQAPLTWTTAIIGLIIGIILGASQWAVDVPPRWFWSKSQSELLETRIGSAIGYGLICFNLPLAIYFIKFMVEYIG